MSRDPAFLLDMLVAATKVRQFTVGITRDQFERDDLRQSATRYQLQIIGEAAWKVSAGYRSQHPHIPWEQIAGLRHRLVHEYGTIDVAKIWDIVEHHIAPLIDALKPLVPPDA